MVMKTGRKHKLQVILQVVLVAAIIAIVNVIAQYTYTRADLTEDKRYSLHEVTKDLLRDLDDVVYVRVYLEGGTDRLPPGFRRLRNSTSELLDEFQQYSGTRLEYVFIDPSEESDSKKRNELYRQLSDEGLAPVNLQVKEGSGESSTVIWPGALVSYKNRTVPVNLLQQQMGVPPLQVLHNSIVNLEYGFAGAIHKLQQSKKPKVAFITGHGEIADSRTADLAQSLAPSYKVENLNLPEYRVGKLNEFDVVIVVKPDTFWSDVDKYKMDQYIMQGGKVLWLAEALKANMEMLDRQGVGVSEDLPLNGLIEDLLFKYGVRINMNLVQSLQANATPIMVNNRGGQPSRLLRKWLFYPLAFPHDKHPVSNNLNAVWLQFANTIDTIAIEGIKKTILLSTSRSSRVLPHPVRFNLQSVQQEPNPSLFNKGLQPVAVLLEGSFTSAFRNRISPTTLESGEYGEFKEQGKNTAMIVVSDGDAAANQVGGQQEGQIYPLGYDRWTEQTFGNKDFLLNAVDYLYDRSGLITLRSKEITMRLLDQSRVKEERLQWQLFNLALPILVIVLFGLLYNYLRKRKYTRVAAS